MDGKKITEETLYQTMKDISELGYRFPGNPPEKRAAEYLMKHMQDAGLEDVTYEPYDVRCYRIHKQELRAVSRGNVYDIPCHPFWYSGPGSVSAKVLNIETGTDASWKQKAGGKIVLAAGKIIGNWFSTHKFLQLYRAAEEAGAAGFLSWVDAPCGLVPRYDEIRESAPAGTIPAGVICREDGLLLDTLTKDDPLTKFEMVSQVECYQGQSGDIYGFLPGTEDIMVVGTHYDSTYCGAVDNASGNAGFLALARYLKGTLKKPHPTILFCAHAGHENNVGARHFALRHEDWIRRAYVLLFLDGFGSSGFSWSEKGVFPTGRDEYRLWHISENPYLIRLALELTKKYNLYPASYVPLCHWAPDPDLEGQFYDRKVPVVMAVGKPIWFHTKEDLPDKIKPEQLYKSFLVYRELAEILIKEDPEKVRKNDRRDHEQLLEDLIPAERTQAVKGLHDRGILLGITPQPARVGETVIFYVNTVMNPDGVTLDFIWDFGDGKTHKDIWAKHQYHEPGRYLVKIMAIDEHGFEFEEERVLWVI